MDNQQQHKEKTRWIYDPKIRAIFYQASAILAVVLFIAYITNNALTNLESRGITTGFGFLSEPAGFGIIQSLVAFDETYSYGRTFIVGLLNTLLVSILGIIIATVIGFIVGVARLSSNWLISRLANAYIETFRNIPLLLQIFFWYFAVLRALPSPRESINVSDTFFLNVRGFYLPSPIFESAFLWVLIAFAVAIVAVVGLVRWAHHKQQSTGQIIPTFWKSIGLLLGLPLLVYFLSGSPMTWEYPELRGFNFRGGFTVIPELMALLLALSIYTAAFIAEIVRSGIEAINKGQTEASLALGISQRRTLRLVIIPQAMRVIIPPLTSQYLNLTKNSSLATAIGYPDLVSIFMGTTLNQTGQAIEVIAITMAVYLTISLLVSMFMNWFNKRMALVER